jgi:hypothetical protein
MSAERTSENEVANRAYHLWEKAGRPHGKDLSFWIQAETEIREPASGARAHTGTGAARPAAPTSPETGVAVKPGRDIPPASSQVVRAAPRKRALRFN